ncbi:hypothetical protein BC567DRAFT_187327 [Phyllosticta citribraziliensis]
MEDMISKYVGKEAVLGEWEGKNIDYRFLGLWEERRHKDLSKALESAQEERTDYEPTGISRVITGKDLGPHTAEIHGVLLPRSNGASSPGNELVPTTTTIQNLTSVARQLIRPGPLLMTGLAGSGKTLIVRHLARELNKLETMVTLHLNEQSDAKLLIGMYTTGTTPGTFSWRPGVLTTAVREGRWVLIEDLDRAPNEVISTLLPLIESGELLIPSRGEVVRAARGFKIIATLRTTLNLRGEEIVPGGSMLGSRFWKRVPVQMLPEEDLGQIIRQGYSRVPNALVPQIMSVYSSLRKLSKEKSVAASKSGIIRPVTSRDLFKWCSRIDARNLDNVFLEAVDCLAGSLEQGAVRDLIVACIARELHVDPQKRDHLLSQRPIAYKPSADDQNSQVTIGRISLRRSQRKKRRNARPFAANEHTRRLLEKIAVAVGHEEPLLLVGETGTGKTTAIQHLAGELGRKLEVFNLSQQSESGDLLGGFKPVNTRSLMVPMKDRFDDLFLSTFSQEKNRLFLDQLNEHMSKGRWKVVCKFWQQALKMVEAASPKEAPTMDLDQPKKKKRRVESFNRTEWDSFANDLKLLESQVANKSNAFAFKFMEGNIVKAVRNGDWVLLDEINLAAPDTLEALADLLTGGSGGKPFILLTETGNVERIEAHPDFRVFAAMNPATDVGKKDLPMGIRSRFTELYVESPDRDLKSLQSVVETYLDQYLHNDRKISTDVANLYLSIQTLNSENKLVDSANQKPHFSLRTLTRTLIYALDTAPLHSLRRALYEGFCMSFLTFLDKSSEDLVADAVVKHLKPELRSPLRKPADKDRDYWLNNAQKDPLWLRKGNFSISDEEHYIITNFVWRNLTNLVRAASTRRFPVLIQGPTSSGKTSMIEYLAKRSGNKFVRINNHEHTDLQEYLGTYISGNDGKLQFQEGVLVKALREGHWIVLDELNLAPTDVLEALNRLLDDNRELLIPETQEVVRPHEDFMLFATQNPAGLYGGRKTLSRAFRNRFLELHFDDIPVNELKFILERRTQLPRSWCDHIVNVYRELSILRQTNRLFESKSFATLRDLFRWAMRGPETAQQLAEQGYMLLAERVRKPEERLAVKRVIEKIIKQTNIDEAVLYSPDRTPEIRTYEENVNSDGVVWTKAMRRLYALVANALRYNEAVLLVGETGCGKTTVCQMLADAFKKQLFIVNAHQNTETGDLIGAQRPIRNRAFLEDHLARDLRAALAETGTGLETLDEMLRVYEKLLKEQPDFIGEEVKRSIHAQRIKLSSLFEWADGSLVTAMKSGNYFLLDEISLADDSVLERLNSVLESSRSLLLAEKGPNDSYVKASPGFQFLATMNPGGDYGKKELSPALRNRFTEIWVPALTDLDDITQIVKAKLAPPAMQYAETIVAFSQWFNEKYNTSAASSISIRDTLAWVSFVNRCDPLFGVVQGAAMVFVDTLGANPAALLAISPANLDNERAMCLEKLSELVGADAKEIYFAPTEISTSDSSLSIGSFSVPRSGSGASDPSFSMKAPTTKSNAMRVLRALQLSKPILLEGNPGVGKTSLVTAIAKAVGIPLTRINLSEQTDLMDLFGSDVPVEGAQAGTFAWRDAPFLKAMKNGEWVLLDEMNLASQSVLEGLNACLDHRGEVYISELDQTFHQHAGFRVFAAQNPHHQGGGRKGLPASFVNRFTVVYADVFRPDDLALICKQQFPACPEDVESLIAFISRLEEEVVNRKFGSLGLLPAGASRDFLDTIVTQRFRTDLDRRMAIQLFDKCFPETGKRNRFFHNIGKDHIQVGLGMLPRNPVLQPLRSSFETRKSKLSVMESMMIAVQLNWPVILVGPPGSGKSSLIRHLAAAVGAELVVSSMNADIDAMDLVGGYEQIDPSRAVMRFLERLSVFSRTSVISHLVSHQPSSQLDLLLSLSRLSSSRVDQLDFGAIRELLTKLPASDELLAELNLVEKEAKTVDQARFQWVDGLLVQALEQGKWLILDNANLCSSSVLDRLNSLLEPNGYLSINEHSTDDGEAKIVLPHPNFRIFMTMDPRHGELSRAMRNRAIEIFMMSDDEPEKGLYAFRLESSLYRFRHLELLGDASSDILTRTSLDHLGRDDSAKLAAFYEQISAGLINVRDLCSLQEQMPFFSHLPQEWMSRANELVAAQAKLIGAGDDFQSAQVSDLAPVSIKQMLITMNPLNNQALVYNQCAPNSYWLAALFELCQDLHKMRESLRTVEEASTSKARDDLAGVGPFLKTTWESLASWTEQVLREGVDDGAALESIKVVCQFWNDLYRLTNTAAVDEAVFQVYLAIGQECLQSFQCLSSQSEHLLEALQNAFHGLKMESQLRTGLSMEVLWQRFKPHTPPTYDGLLGLLKLEGLADRFDEAVWKVDVPLAELARVRMSLSSALELVSTRSVPAEELVADLETAIDELEKNVPEGREPIRPFFEDAFEGLCQYADLVDAQNDGTMALATLLARRPTRAASNDVNEVLNGRLSQYLGGNSDAGPIAVRQSYHVHLLEHFGTVGDASLSRMSLLQSEMQVLGQALAQQTGNMMVDQTALLDRLHRGLLQEIFTSHADLLQDGTPVLKSDLSDNHYFHTALRLLQDSISYVSSQNVAPWQAWIALAIGCLWLYVPDKPFDPALRPLVERGLFGSKRESLLASLSALRHFEQAFSGREDNLRTQLIQDDIERMGAEPSVPQIARPPTSELAQLSGEFGNLLRILDGLVRAIESGDGEFVKDPTLEINIGQVVKRLSEGYRAYDDITGPAVAFLQCLRVGVILAEDRQSVDPTMTYLVAHTPFMNRGGELLSKDFEILQPRNKVADLRWHALNALAVTASIEPDRILPIHERTTVHDIFVSFYTQWKEKLEADQEKAAEDTGLYKFKGDQDVEEEATEEELRAMFPDFEQEPASNPESPQELTRRLASAHADIFIHKTRPTDKIRSLMDKAVQAISRGQVKNAGGQDGLHATLPAIFLTLHQQSEDLLQDTPSSRHYNFYTDANVGEAKKLIELIHRVQKRFRQIRDVWPEHATLSDVLFLCDELLAFKHVEPVAKFLTKGEKLHAAIYQWQQVASREYSAATLYNDATNLLISWRQLELTTWAKLFDIETERSYEDGKGWFFIAFETVVVAAESLGDAASVDDHATQLLKTLELFALSTTAGQYSSRLRLLEQLREHVALREMDVPSIKPVRTALDNFIRYFIRYEQPVRDMVAKGRVDLEKKVKEVIKLASWKDRNIDALRQSAKTSHNKLFRLVRKFRVLLNQPVQSVLLQDFPEGPKMTSTHTQSQAVEVNLAPETLALCEYVPSWATRPSRFKDVHATVRLMHKMARPRGPNGPSHIGEFLEHLETSMAELQKATPSTLTEENKNDVKHLKSQKRKLFTDTLKVIREMGFRSHVGGDVLAKQDSLATVLARLPNIPPSTAESYLHRTLNLMQQVRDISREHSGDLTNADVARSVANFESMLHTSIKQREALSKALEDEALLGRTMEQIDALSSNYPDATTQRFDLPTATVAWVPPMLRVGAQIVAAQAKLGKLAVDDVVQGLDTHASAIQDLLQEVSQLPALPKGIACTAHETMATRIGSALDEIRSKISQWQRDFPVLDYILQRILPWLQVPTSANGIVGATTSIPDVSNKVFAALDAVLGSMQDVEKAHDAIPESVELPSWLVSESNALAASCKALHAASIDNALRAALNSLHQLPVDELKAAGAMVTALAPIVAEYRVTQRDAIARFGQLHEATCRMNYRLAKSFIVVGTRGFCTPSEAADQQGGQSDKLEGGTGLGEGEGAEDISKDIGEDEDMTELAQDKGEKEDERDIEDEQDAVDMGEDEMEGQMGDAPEKEDEEGDEEKEGEDDMEDETGEVDDLGPSTVDEKMWDEGGDEDDKDREAEDTKGSKDKEENAAAAEKEGEKKSEGEEAADEEEEPEQGAEEEERVGGPEETEQMDPHTEQGETLDLPEDLNFDEDQKSQADSDGMDDMDDMDDAMEEEGPAEGEEQQAEEGANEEDAPAELDNEPEEAPGIDDENKEEQAVEPEEKQEEENNEQLKGTDEMQIEKTEDDAAAETGVGLDANDDTSNDKDESSGAQREEGAEGDSAENQQAESEEQGARGNAAQQDAVGHDDELQAAEESQPFKKLGDMLEKWYNQQRQIQNASKEERPQPQEKDADMADGDFEHLPDDDAEADAQALGAAEEDQAKALDREMAQDVNEKAELPENLPQEVSEQEANQDEDVQMQDAEPALKDAPEEQEQSNGQPNAFVGEKREQPDAHFEDDLQNPLGDESDAEIEEVEHSLSTTSLSEDYPRSAESARALWQHHEATTRTLSQSLTEQLRLILAPTLATKMRGGHRTGKRLNMKAIIPYIASQYKRDKIWLRRSLPSKRAYQIMLALDDSRSMGDAGTSALAFETLALVSKALSLLEAGDMSVVRFGADVRVAHPFDAPFGSQAGVDVFRQFGFGQDKTDVRALVEAAISLFRDARARASGAAAELWQLALVISDGVCGDHEYVARLVRQAQEERIMIVFVVVDAPGGSKTNQAASPSESGAGEAKGSVLDLLDVRFEDGKLIKRRYMDSFPFRWYVVVRDVKELPGVLSTALRQWFAEVVDTAF